MLGQDSLLGHVFSDRYTAVSVIGSGENSIVYGAVDRTSGQTVALKLLRPEKREDASALERFETEIHLLSLFHHPNIVKLLDHATDGEYRFFVMEYIEGITLKKLILSRGILDLDELVFVSGQILSALSEVHNHGIVHSDIKPQNIVITDSGEIKLMDFGISKKLIDQDENLSGTTVGTVHYVSPEQAEGKPLDHLSDIYSFGVMLYEMATGSLPFTDTNPNKVASMHVSLPPTPPRLVEPRVSPELESIILRTLDKTPAARFPSAKDLDDALRALLCETPKEEHLPPKDIVRDIKYRIRAIHLPSAFIGCLCALFVCVVIGLAILLGRIAAERENRAYIRVPDLVGNDFTSVDALGLDEERYEIRVEYVDNPSRSGQILSQSPDGDKIIKGNCVITLTVARKAFPDTMPALAGLPGESLETILKEYDITANVVALPHAYLPKGTVIATLPEAGTPRKAGITVYVSDGYREVKNAVPDFTGLTRTEATARAMKNGFSLVTFSDYVGNGTVTAQSLAPGEVTDAAGCELILTLGEPKQ